MKVQIVRAAIEHRGRPSYLWRMDFEDAQRLAFVCPHGDLPERAIRGIGSHRQIPESAEIMRLKGTAEPIGDRAWSIELAGEAFEVVQESVPYKNKGGTYTQVQFRRADRTPRLVAGAHVTRPSGAPDVAGFRNEVDAQADGYVLRHAEIVEAVVLPVPFEPYAADAGADNPWMPRIRALTAEPHATVLFVAEPGSLVADPERLRGMLARTAALQRYYPSLRAVFVEGPVAQARWIEQYFRSALDLAAEGPSSSDPNTTLPDPAAVRRAILASAGRGLTIHELRARFPAAPENALRAHLGHLRKESAIDRVFTDGRAVWVIKGENRDTKS